MGAHEATRLPGPNSGVGSAADAVEAALATGIERASAGNRLVDPVTGQWAAIPDNGGWVFAGGGEGTVSFLIQRLWDEVNVAVIFNSDGGFDPIDAEHKARILEGLGMSEVATWSAPESRS